MLKLDFCLIFIIVRMYFTFRLDVTLISGGLRIVLPALLSDDFSVSLVIYL